MNAFFMPPQRRVGGGILIYPCPFVIRPFVRPDIDTLILDLVIFSSTFRRKKVELLSSLQRQRLGWLSFLSEFISQKLSKVSIWNLEYLFTIKRGTNYNKADDPVICISRVICPCFDIVHRNWGYLFSIIKISQ